ncbi:MAG TPA: hypothetical protein VK644_05755 [Chitinophagaceae bacterium]|nr:hypothetical protein [Chitinophagaceae bacterium]
MEQTYLEPKAYKPIMAGLFTGIVATVLNIFYDIFYRGSTGFQLTPLINVATIIFGTLLVLLVAGSIYAILARFVRQVNIVYILLFLILTVYAVFLTMHVQRAADPVLITQFRGLLLGIVIISGTLTIFLVPYLATHETSII